MFRVALAALALSIAAFPVSAQTLRCEFSNSKSQGNWIAPVVVAKLAADGKTAELADCIVCRKFNKPITADVVTNTDAKLVVSWEFRTQSRTGQMVRANYRLAYFRAKGKANLTMKPLGYSNSFTSTGPCTLGAK